MAIAAQLPHYHLLVRQIAHDKFEFIMANPTQSTLGSIPFCPLAGVSVEMAVTRYEGTSPIQREALAVSSGQTRLPVSMAGGKAQLECDIKPSGKFTRAHVRLTAGDSALSSVAISLEFLISDWSIAHELLIPGAVYSANRYPQFPYKTDLVAQYPDPANMPVTISGAPQLNPAAGPSRIQLLSGDTSSSVVALFCERWEQVLIMGTDQRTWAGEIGIDLVESDDRKALRCRFVSPGVREGRRYNGIVSRDRAADLSPGQTLSLDVRVWTRPAKTLADAYRALFDLQTGDRFELPPPSHVDRVPLGQCWQRLERKYNDQNWVEDEGYYSVGMREKLSQDWQTSWVGGLNAVRALVAAGTTETRRRAARTFEFLFQNGGQFESGLLRTMYYRGKWWFKQRVLTRYQGDALHIFGRMFDQSRAATPDALASELAERWKDGVARVADAMCRVFRQHGEFGHYLEGATGEMLIPRTASAAGVPGGLALLARVYNRPDWLEVAVASAAWFETHSLKPALTNAGPGDILQGQDSESCFSLLDMFIVLWEETGDRRWLDDAICAAHQFATWVVPYDFQFPAFSTFGKMGMTTNGTVIANIKNKHSAPGICTRSGDALLRLYRATGDTRYLQLLADIARAMPQYMSRNDRLIPDIRPDILWPVMPDGWVNERVNMSDWEERGTPGDIRVGEIFGGSCWSEVSVMLSFAELPSVYVDRSAGRVFLLDHLLAELAADGHLTISNPTPFDTTVLIASETDEQRAKTLPSQGFTKAIRLQLPAGETRNVQLP